MAEYTFAVDSLTFTNQGNRVK